MNEILQIKDLSVGYANKPNILKSINLTVYENDFLGIIGPNGGGKTTLLKTILNLIKPCGGQIIFYKNGQNVKDLNIGYLPQINKIDKNFPISVFEVVQSGLKTKRLFNRYSIEQKSKVHKIIEDMGLTDLSNRPIGELSGGQLQRALLGRAIVDDPDLLILDEPSSYVDKRFETNFYNSLQKINETTAIILVSHDIGTIIPLIKNIACVNEGLHYHQGSDISSEWIEKTYSGCPIELVTHGDFPHRVLDKHNNCDCCNEQN
ncbi:MAG: metal ABC transporter ATP-binding protein [Dysgonomonas sp.]